MQPAVWCECADQGVPIKLRVYGADEQVEALASLRIAAEFLLDTTWFAPKPLASSNSPYGAVFCVLVDFLATTFSS